MAMNQSLIAQCQGASSTDRGNVGDHRFFLLLLLEAYHRGVVRGLVIGSGRDP